MGVYPLWECVMGQVQTFVEENDGETLPDYEIKTVRPDWDELYEFIYNNCGDTMDDLFELPCEEN